MSAADLDPACAVGQKVSEPGDKLWLDAISLQLTVNKTGVQGVNRFGEIEVHHVNIFVITDGYWHPFLRYRKARYTGPFGNESVLQCVVCTFAP